MPIQMPVVRTSEVDDIRTHRCHPDTGYDYIVLQYRNGIPVDHLGFVRVLHDLGNVPVAWQAWGPADVAQTWLGEHETPTQALEAFRYRTTQ